MRVAATIMLGLACFLASCGAGAAKTIQITIKDAEVTGGKLVVTGKTPGPVQTISLDGKYAVTSNSSKSFTFEITDYLPRDCVAHFTIGASYAATAVVANCAVSATGADVTGNISVSGVTNGRCTPISLTVNGAKIGDSVIFTPQVALQSGIFFLAANVTADNTAAVNVCNLSGTTMTAIVNLPVRVITFP